MNFKNLEFFLKEAFFGLSRNQLMSLVAVITITISLVIYGTFILGLYNIFSMTASLQNKVEVMVYVKDNVDDSSLDKIKTEITSLVGVKQADFISKAEAWEKFKSKFALSLELIGDDRKNPLPHTFKVQVTDVKYIDSVAQSVKGIEDVEEVRYGNIIAQKLKKLIRAIQVGGTILVVLLVIATLLIIVNTIRLTVIARQNEITIMQLVGATDNFIKWPFIIEGIILGLFGAVTATLMLRFIYNALISKVSQSLPFLAMVTGKEILTFIYISVIVIGTFLGMVGGYISVSRTLKMSYK
ncbi:MAG TPA: hypothetical protein DF296_11375 [Candidatus Margulisbacteria bacterium]|nr:MAG: hypothetical protein A2X43_07905 [Candidatus Margulisbacteria bacterium GWD2_39_127]OGI03652.1 MAG: hypothetical protein A2X42_06385 [Candidatus Margulisbacteria bacterium GWF2_38_17]OGI05644.1 MAG: hypothetical protein A2X41_03435 [Candidatus Margulisbacteria bacterium GWE2_39_32]HAR63713.1 hypothetical protein [Candidatus Margulisiibacteriota bacterium]HCT85781.1 hypothetical protein [Candidatus Margulisiibacteriota bacterium]